MRRAPLPNSVSGFRSVGTRFSPGHFLGPQSRPVSCYAIFEGWLLLSPPPGCFRLPTPFRITLDRNLGTLTAVWVVSLMATKLTPDGLTPDVYGERKFGVRQDAEEFLPLSTQSVLYLTLRLGRGLAATSFRGNQLFPA